MSLVVLWLQPSTGLGDYSGRYLRYGVREHGMAAIMNGIAAYGGLIPYGGTFLNFITYVGKFCITHFDKVLLIDLYMFLLIIHLIYTFIHSCTVMLGVLSAFRPSLIYELFML